MSFLVFWANTKFEFNFKNLESISDKRDLKMWEGEKCQQGTYLKPRFNKEIIEIIYSSL